MRKAIHNKLIDKYTTRQFLVPAGLGLITTVIIITTALPKVWDCCLGRIIGALLCPPTPLLSPAWYIITLGSGV